MSSRTLRSVIGALVCALMLGMGIGAHPTAAQTTFIVNTTADAVDVNIGNGQCRTAAGKCSLRAAIQEANANPDITTITLKEAIYKTKLIGVGENASVAGDYDITTYIIIDGLTASKTVIDANFLDRAFDVHDNGKLDLSNMTVKNGVLASGDGGAVNIVGASAYFYAENVTFTENSSGNNGSGGAISATGEAVVSIIASKFIGNSGGKGGAVSLYDAGTTVMIDNLFDDNSSSYGGALNVYSTALTVRGGRFETNSAACVLTTPCNATEVEGGALYIDSAQLMLDDVTITSNTSTGYSGAFVVDNSQISVSGVSVLSNTAVNSGGGHLSQVSGTVEASAFISNTSSGATSQGGGLHIEATPNLLIKTSTFSGNTAAFGGGIYVVMNKGVDTSHLLRLTHITLGQNVATNSGGGLYFDADNGGLTVVASALSSNVGVTGPDCAGVSIPFTNSFISNDSGCTLTGTGNQVDVAVGLGGLSYGIYGATLAHMPQVGSPLINAEAPCTIESDQHANVSLLDQPCTVGAIGGMIHNLLTNESFESGPSGWVIVSPDGKDKVINKSAFSGTRAFSFTGGVGKTATLRQKVVGAALNGIQAGDMLCANVMAYTTNPTGKNMIVQIFVKYSDGVSAKASERVVFVPFEYATICSRTIIVDLTGGRTITQVEARVINRSTSGKVIVDNVSALLFEVGGGRGQTRNGAIQGLPDAPEGFRQ